MRGELLNGDSIRIDRAARALFELDHPGLGYVWDQMGENTRQRTGRVLREIRHRYHVEALRWLTVADAVEEVES